VLPEYDYLYLADSARAPYGTRDPETILRFSIDCTRFLFEHGATIVIIACNTATAHAIRPLQQIYFPDKKILGITIP
jgi:glutamate racemase